MTMQRGKYVALMPEYTGNNAVSLREVFETLWREVSREYAIEYLRGVNHRRVRQSTIDTIHDEYIQRNGMEFAHDWRRFIAKVCGTFGRDQVVQNELPNTAKYNSPMRCRILLNGRVMRTNVHRSSVPQSDRCTWNAKVYATPNLKSPAYYGK